MQKLFAASLMAALFGFPGTGVAQDSSLQIYSGNDLYALCAPSQSDRQYSQERGECLGYILGVADSQMLTSAGMGVSQLFCLPPSVSYRQLQDIVIADLRANPGERHTAASGLVWASLIKAFPCKLEVR